MATPTPADFKTLIPDPSGSKCAAFTRALLQLPNLLYQWMLANTDSAGRIKGALKAGDYIYSAAPLAEDASRLLCNGQEVSKTTYALLFAALGTLYGAASSPATNFKVPDHRARFPIAVGSTAKPIAIALGATGGEDEHVLLVAELAAHHHSITTTGAGKAGDSFRNPANPDPASGYPTNDDQVTNDTGSDTAHNNMPPWIGVYVYVSTGLGV